MRGVVNQNDVLKGVLVFKDPEVFDVNNVLSGMAGVSEASVLDNPFWVEVVEDGVCIGLVRSGEDDHLMVDCCCSEAFSGVWPDVDELMSVLFVLEALSFENHV